MNVTNPNPLKNETNNDVNTERHLLTATGTNWTAEVQSLVDYGKLQANCGLHSMLQSTHYVHLAINTAHYTLQTKTKQNT